MTNGHKTAWQRFRKLLKMCGGSSAFTIITNLEYLRLHSSSEWIKSAFQQDPKS